MIQELWLGDCLTLMKKIPDKSIDLIICDLPYGTTKCSWDIIIPFVPLWEQYHRIAKPTTPVLLFGQEPFSSYLRLSNIKHYKYDVVWQKNYVINPLQVKRRPGKVLENISVFYRKQPTYNPQKTYNPRAKLGPRASGQFSTVMSYPPIERVLYVDDGTRFPLQIVQFPRDNKQIHPTQKPLALLEYLIKTYSNPNDLILDNTMGSGTTCLAAKNLDRQYIGMEKDINHYWKARRRIGETVPSILYKTEKGE